jgi:hypothetical protein
MRHIKYYIIISCLLKRYWAQTLSLDAILTNVKTNNPQLKCTMPTYRVWMQQPKEHAVGWHLKWVQACLWLPQHKSRYGVLYDRCDTNDSDASRLKADSDYMNMSSVEVENKNYTVNQLNALVKRIITNGLYLIKNK